MPNSAQKPWLVKVEVGTAATLLELHLRGEFRLAPEEAMMLVAKVNVLIMQVRDTYRRA